MVYRIDHVTVGSGRAGGREIPEAGTPYYSLALSRNPTLTKYVFPLPKMIIKATLMLIAAFRGHFMALLSVERFAYKAGILSCSRQMKKCGR
jgi:hypothetical protein